MTGKRFHAGSHCRLLSGVLNQLGQTCLCRAVWRVRAKFLQEHTPPPVAPESESNYCFVTEAHCKISAVLWLKCGSYVW